MMPTHADSPDGPHPVAAVGDPAVPAEDRQPDERDEGQRHGEPDQRGPDEPGTRVDGRVAGRDDEPDEDPDDRRGRETGQVGGPVAGLHHERV